MVHPRLALAAVFAALFATAWRAARAPQHGRLAEEELPPGSARLSAALHHLGDSVVPEWREASAEPEGGSLAFDFELASTVGESVLALRQRDVDDRWHLVINGVEVATLAREKDPAWHLYTLPEGALRPGRNRFELGCESTSDDIVVGDVRLYTRALRALLSLQPVRIRVRASGAASPARVTVLDASGAMANLYYAGRDLTAVRAGVAYCADGEVRCELPPGRYSVHATRGIEWSAAHAELEIGAGAAEVALEISREVDTSGFLATDTHVHTLTFSGHGDASVAERLVTLAGEGVELAVATDHNHHTDYRPLQAELGLSRWFTPVVGNEVTTPIGHFNGFPFDPSGPIPEHDLRDVTQIVSGMRQKGAQAVILNHPRWPEHETGPFGSAGMDPFTGASSMPHPYDAMELINSETRQVDPMVLFRDWFGLLDRGEHVVAVASSDSHTVAGVVGMGRTYLMGDDADVSKLDVPAAARALREGRSSISMGIFADVRAAGRFRMGDTLPATALAPGRSLALELRVAAPGWVRPRRAQVFVDGVERASRELDARDGAPTDETLSLRVELPVHDAWVVCLVRGDGVDGAFWPQLNPYTLAATNPLWVDVDGDGVYRAPRDTARALLAKAAAASQASGGPGNAGGAGDLGDAEAFGRALAGCDEAVVLQGLDLLEADYREQALARLRAVGASAAGDDERVRAYLDARRP